MGRALFGKVNSKTSKKKNTKKKPWVEYYEYPIGPHRAPNQIYDVPAGPKPFKEYYKKPIGPYTSGIIYDRPAGPFTSGILYDRPIGPELPPPLPFPADIPSSGASRAPSPPPLPPSPLISAEGSRAPSRAPSPPPARRARRARRGRRGEIDHRAFNKKINGQPNPAQPRQILRALNSKRSNGFMYRFNKQNKTFEVKQKGTVNVKAHKVRRTYKGAVVPRRWNTRYPNEYEAIVAMIQ